MPFAFSRQADAHVDLSSLDAFNDGAPFETFARMRREDPMAWSDMTSGETGFWSVTRHADLLELNRQADLLSSARGIRMEDQTMEEVEARKTFQETDAPHHRGFRALVSKAFSKGSVSQFEDQIRKIVTELLDVALEEGEFDAVDRIARRLPMQMLAQIMGVPQEDGPFLVEKGDALISNSDPDYTDFVVDRTFRKYRFFFTSASTEAATFPVAGFMRFTDGSSLQVINETPTFPPGTGRMFGPFQAVPGKRTNLMNFRVGSSTQPAALGFSYRISVQGCT
jgi:cytochrome P450